MEALFGLFASDEVLVQIFALCMAMPRLLTILGMVPFFGSAVTTSVKGALFLVLYLPLQPCLVHELRAFSSLADVSALTLFLLAAKESLLGLALAFTAGVLFYAALSAGMVIDNQRGASQAQGQDIMSGVENSPFGSVLFLSLVTLFFSTGAVMAFITLLYQSFVAWPVFSFVPQLTSADFGLFIGWSVNNLVLQALLICGPFIMVSLMTDISLGIINRFAPQLNVFILSMPIKSGLCAFLIVFFIVPYFDLGEQLLGQLDVMLRRLLDLLAAGGTLPAL